MFKKISNDGQTFTQIHIQSIFAVQNRTSLLKNEWKNRMYQYIIGTLNQHGHKTLAINGIPDHVHLFFGMRPTQSLSDLMQNKKEDHPNGSMTTNW